MIILLLCILIIELIVAYLVNGKRIVSPSIIAIGVFIFSSLLYALFMDSFFGSDISLITVLVVSILLAFVILGERVSSIFVKTNSNFIRRNVYHCSFKASNLIILFAGLFVTAVSVWYFYDVYKFSLSLGNSPGDFISAPQYVRHASSYGTGRSVYSSGLVLGQLLLISKCVVYFSLYIFLESIFVKKKPKWMCLLSFFGYFIYVFFCDSRGYLIADIMVFIIILNQILSNAGFSNKKINKILVVFGLASFVAFFILFRILGYRTGTSLHFSFATNLVDYASSGIFGLDLFLQKPFYDNSYFAQNILRNVYLKLNDFGFNFVLGGPNADYFVFLGGQSNIYTGLRSLINDLGVFSCLFLFLWSFATTIMLRNKRYRFTMIHSYLLGMLFYPLVMISVGGEWANVISITTLYMVFYLFIIEYLLNSDFLFVSHKYAFNRV